MGYEVKFLYFEKDTENGGYNREEEKYLFKKIGKSTEDVPVEKLAFAIMNQMARRDIWVEDVEIYEFIKKRVNFKESTSGDGIIIGGRKFGANTSFDHVSDVEEDEVKVKLPEKSPQDQLIVEMQKQLVEMQKQLMSQNNVQNIGSNQRGGGGLNLQEAERRAALEDQAKKQQAAMKKDPKIHPIRLEYFKPDPALASQLRSKGLKFTLNKKYPIYDERMSNNGLAYVTQDDVGERIVMHSIYFVPNIGVSDSTGLLQSDNSYDRAASPKLTYDGNGYGSEVYRDPDSGQNFGMPDVRPAQRIR